jgi:hypothetical protein
MLIVIRAIQAVFLLAGVACAIGAVVVVGALVDDTKPCQVDEDGKATAYCEVIPNYQVQATVGVAYALASGAMMLGAVAVGGMARPSGPLRGGMQRFSLPTPPSPVAQPTGPMPRQMPPPGPNLPPTR